MYNVNHEKNKMSSQQTDNIEVLSERLGSLKITNKTSSKINRQLDKEMSIALALAMINNNVQAVILKSIVPDLVWFIRD